MNVYSSKDRPFPGLQGEEFREDARLSGEPGVAGHAQTNRSRRRLSARELAPLTRIVNWRSAAAVLQTWLIIASPVGIALAYWSWPLALAAVVVIGTQQHALFILSHDAAHYRLFEHRGFNDLIGRVCAAAAGLSMCTYRVIHRLHHNHLYGPQDPDIALHGGYPRGKWYLVSKLLKDLSGLTAVKTYGYFFGNPAKSTTTQSALQPVLFPHHVNYHVEHHSYPAVPHYHLRKLHDLLAARGLLGGAEVRTIGATMQMIFADPARSRTRG